MARAVRVVKPGALRNAQSSYSLPYVSRAPPSATSACSVGNSFVVITALLSAGKLPSTYRTPPTKIVGTRPVHGPNSPPIKEPAPRAP
jgi:hypothetical protein